jgi:DNA-binding XRE family transcriptional regulator
MPDPTSFAEIGARLVMTRKALGYTQTMMGRLIGPDVQIWENYETGRWLIPIDHALALCSYGISLDWI